MTPVQFPKTGKADTTSTSAGKTTEEIKTEVQARIDQIHATEQEQSAYLSSDDIAELDKMETLLQGSLALLDQFEKTGALSMPSDPATTDPSQIPNSAALKAGWNGSFDTAKDGSGIYNVILLPHNLGKDVKNGLIYKAQNGETVIGKSVGNDLEVTVTAKDGSAQKYLIKGVGKNSIPVIVAADQTTEGVTVNFAQARIAGGLTILGGSGDDTLIGSQGNDKIYGNAGADTIHGMGGTNQLFGGEGADILYGGSGTDTLSGEAGFDAIYKAKGDTPTDPEDVHDIETQALDKANFKGSGWAEAENADGTELVVSKKDPNAKDDGKITLTIPDGYMAFGKKDGDDLVLTFQQINDDGTPGDTRVVRLKGFLAGNNQTTLVLVSESSDGHPTMVDLGGVNAGFNTVTFKKGEGSDVMVPPKTAFDDLGINKDDLGKPTLDAKTTKDIKEEWFKDDDFKKTLKENSTTSGAGVITLTPKSDQADFDIPLPDGYTKAVVQADKDGKGYTVTMFITDTKTGEPGRLVIHVVKTGGNPQNVLIDGPHVVEFNE